MPLLSIYLVYRKFYKFVYIGISITKIIPVGIADKVIVVAVGVARRVNTPSDVGNTCVRRSSPVGIDDIVAAVIAEGGITIRVD